MIIIAILGYQLAKNREDLIHPVLKARLDLAFKFCLNIKDMNDLVICSGGDVLKIGVTEAEIMKKYLVSKNINEKNIILEPESLNTVQNLKFIKNIIRNLLSKNKYDKLIIITSDFHLNRVKQLGKILFQDISLNFEVIGSDTPVDMETYHKLVEHETKNIIFLKNKLDMISK